jgi:hypothetical protein
MKVSYILPILFISLSSCYKDRNCQCTVTDKNGVAHPGQRNVIKGTKRSARKACESYNYEYADSKQVCHSE